MKPNILLYSDESNKICGILNLQLVEIFYTSLDDLINLIKYRKLEFDNVVLKDNNINITWKTVMIARDTYLVAYTDDQVLTVYYEKGIKDSFLIGIDSKNEYYRVYKNHIEGKEEFRSIGFQSILQKAFSR